MSFEHYVNAGTKRLRCGYTTGSCAALAAQAAAKMLFAQQAVSRARIVVPGGLAVEADVEQADFGPGFARCGVRKDAGDDVDATDGLLICVELSFADRALPAEAAAHAASGTGSSCACLLISGGEGVGRVTKPGLDQPVGEAAINATPRAMIAAEILGVCERHGFHGTLNACVSVPGGAEAAGRTFNPHLGIEGGISILGTSGIVEPRSLAALRDAIELEIHQKAVLGAKDIVLTPGNYGERFVSDVLGVSEGKLVVVSNFIGAALDCAVREGFKSILVVGHIGKLVKVAGGIMDTHSRTADCRCEILCAHAALAGGDAELARCIMQSATTLAAFSSIDASGHGAAVRASLAVALLEHLERRVAGSAQVAALVFDGQRQELFRTEGASDMIEQMKGA